MLRCLVVLLIGCHHAAAPSPTAARCPERETQFAIAPGTCTAPAPAECRGVCGVVVSRGMCVPLRGRTVVIAGKTAQTDDAGRFDIEVPAGHYLLEIQAGIESHSRELDVTGSPQPLPAPLELTRPPDRSCACGGDCPC